MPYVLRGKCGVKIGVIVQITFDGAMALARPPFEANWVKDTKHPTAIFDQPLFFESPGGYRNRGTGASEHVSKKFLRYFPQLGLQSYSTDCGSRYVRCRT
jgi:hypothetical protein